VLALGAPAPALAQPGPDATDALDTRDPDARDHGDFWAEVVSPNHDELLAIKQQLREALSIAAVDWNPDHRAALLREATRLARHGQRLDPGDPELTFYLGALADDAGRTLEARRLLGELTRGATRGPLRGDALVRLAKLALRQGAAAEALAPLRQAVAERADRRMTVIATVYLADALDATGRTAAAIDLLSQRVAAATGNWDNEEALTVLALAVLYDRDDQISQAFDLLLRAQGALAGAYAERFEAGLALAPPVPAAELHYHRAFLYETAGFLHEARAEWLAYLRLGSGRGLVRARAHLAAVDAQLRDRRPARGKRP
jgi:tetratricopeptide (TPR) repeat protein